MGCAPVVKDGCIMGAPFRPLVFIVFRARSDILVGKTLSDMPGTRMEVSK